jgi:mono/diheme cytochrome c family protein
MGRALLFVAAVVVSAQTPDFNSEVKPIFDKACMNCHGPKMQMGGLRLDSKKLSEKAIKPGHSADSSLYQRIAGVGDQARMPMGGKPLTKAEIDTIQRWIDAGAVWPDAASTETAEIRKHWAFVPPVRPAVPEVKNSGWVRNPIDAFILARLEKEGLSPSPAADKATLLRRLGLDVTGLPPSIKELASFGGADSPDGWKREVDRLLASPHYGERWGRIWLDAARYADSDGFEKDKSRQVWFYRDWVINALNRDLTYDRFIIEQIAGDLLPKATQDQIVATGFLRNSMINEEGGIDPEQFRMEAMYDRMEAIGKGILGLTIQCAQCHNHKYDPLKQEEYYKLFAFLNNTHESTIAVYTPEEQKKRLALMARIAEFEK